MLICWGLSARLISIVLQFRKPPPGPQGCTRRGASVPGKKKFLKVIDGERLDAGETGTLGLGAGALLSAAWR